MNCKKEFSLLVAVFCLLIGLNTQTVKSNDHKNVKIITAIEPPVIDVNYFNNILVKKVPLNSELFFTQDKFLYMNTKLLLTSKWRAIVDEKNINNHEKSINTLLKMQKLALYISDKYKLNLNETEQIIISTFQEANQKNLEPMLVLSLIKTESTFNRKAVSNMGAIGLTQVIPLYHQDKIDKSNINIYKIDDNIKLGTQILSEYLALSDGNMDKALQRYNGSLKDNTKSYSKKVYKNIGYFNEIWKNT